MYDIVQAAKTCPNEEHKADNGNGFPRSDARGQQKRPDPKRNADLENVKTNNAPGDPVRISFQIYKNTNVTFPQTSRRHMLTHPIL
jgi:hypothetical protein